MEARRLESFGPQRFGRRLVKRPVRPAHQVVLRTPDLLQDRFDRLYVGRLAGVRSATDGQLGVGEPEGVGRAVGDERQRLERFRRRAEEREEVGVACPGEQAALRVDEGRRDAMLRLDPTAARYLDYGFTRTHVPAPRREYMETARPTRIRPPPTAVDRPGTSLPPRSHQARRLAPMGSPRTARFTT